MDRGEMIQKIHKSDVEGVSHHGRLGVQEKGQGEVEVCLLKTVHNQHRK